VISVRSRLKYEDFNFSFYHFNKYKRHGLSGRDATHSTFGDK